MCGNNAVDHMLSGKAVSRAVRGHFCLTLQLNAMLVGKATGAELTVGTDTGLVEVTNCTSDISELSQLLACALLCTNCAL